MNIIYENYGVNIHRSYLSDADRWNRQILLDYKMSIMRADMNLEAVYWTLLNKGFEYWINTSKQMAKLILDKYGADSPRWRAYLFDRYVDIIIKESIYYIGKRQIDISIDEIARTLDNVTSTVLDHAANDLTSFLFDD